jgi:polyphosphate kinase
MSRPDPRTEPSRFLNRELSWLEFNRRVLALAEDAKLPLLERVKFLAIVSTNLDEFFQVRVGTLKARVDSGHSGQSPDGLSPARQLEAIRVAVTEQLQVHQLLFQKDLRPALAAVGIRLLDWKDLDAEQKERLHSHFARSVLPVLTPLAVDPAHPFPSISNLSKNLALILRDPVSGSHRFARLKVPALLPRFIALPDGSGFLPIEQLVSAYAGSLFPGREVMSSDVFRITLDAELAIDEREHEDLHAAIKSGLHRRHRTNDAVRLEVAGSTSRDVLTLLQRELGLTENDVYVTDGMLDLSCLWELYALDRPELKSSVWAPQTPAALDTENTPDDIFDALNEGDVLVHHPYESFRGSVQALLTQAAEDPDVLAIKNTLYRTSGKENPVTHALVRAARAGKEVVALIELKARFDEESNLEWANWLHSAGVHVVYGLVGLKTHAKIALIVRREGDEIRRYWHIGTGNYNPATADFYEDVGLLSTNSEIGAELARLFDHLTGWSEHQAYRKLLVAPHDLRRRLIEQIRLQAALPNGHITIKCNGLSDPECIDALYDASQAGCRVDLLVRGICCLRPGVRGMSENIRVRSIVGRFLEHSRIFRFGPANGERRYFIGSVDLMSQKLDKSVELCVEVDDPSCRGRLDEILDIDLAENALAWDLGPFGDWLRADPPTLEDSQECFQAIAVERSRASAVTLAKR